MIYRDFKGTKLSMLGFGTMRLPVLENGQIDAALTQKMVDYAMAHGVNYYDTAWPYMQNRSETVVGQCLKKHPRDSFYLATKMPLWQCGSLEEAQHIFEEQLRRLGVEYIDFYLLHSLYVARYDRAKEMGIGRGKGRRPHPKFGLSLPRQRRRF